MMKTKWMSFWGAMLMGGTMCLGQETEFTYQGSLEKDGAYVEGDYDFTFEMFTAPIDGKEVGSDVVLTNVPVSAGVFSAVLDFGATFDGTPRFLQISVKPSGAAGAAVTLSPRQKVTAAPFALGALEAESVGSSAIETSMVRSGAITRSKLSSEVTDILDSVGTPGEATEIVVVDAAGGGDFTSISAALASVTPTVDRTVIIDLLPGVYRGRVHMKSHVHLRGSGMGNTIIVFDHETEQTSERDVAVILMENLEGVQVTGVTLTTDGYQNPGEEQECVGILDVASSPVIREVRVTNVRGVNLPEFPEEVCGVGSINSSPVIRDCRFRELEDGGSVALNGSKAHVSSCVMEGGFFGVDASEGSEVVVIGNCITDCGEGVRGDLTSKGVIGHNRIGGDDLYRGMSLNNGFSVVGNEIVGGEKGILFVGGGVISGNIIIGSEEYGVAHDGAGDMSITGNTISSTGPVGQGLFLNGSAVVSGNVVRGTDEAIVTGGGAPIVYGNQISGGAPRALEAQGPVISEGENGGNFTAYNPEDQRASVHLSWFKDVARIRVGGTGGTDSGAQNGFAIQTVGDGNLLRILGDGSVGIGTETPKEKLQVVGNILATGTINGSSDVNQKKNFEAVDVDEVLDEVLELPIQRWAYRTESDDISHMGPMAQDFHNAFGLGQNEVTIATVDADGVALAAVQGLNKKLEARLEKKDQELEAMKKELESLKEAVREIRELKGGLK